MVLVVNPARAGMILLYTIGIAISGGKPRASGDDPGHTDFLRRRRA